MASNRLPPNQLFIELVAFTANMLRLAKGEFGLKQPEFTRIVKEGEPFPELRANTNYLKFLLSVVDEKKAFSWTKEAREAYKQLYETIKTANISTTANAPLIEFQVYRQAYEFLTLLGDMKNEKEIAMKLENFDRLHENNKKASPTESIMLHEITRNMIREEIFGLLPVLEVVNKQAKSETLIEPIASQPQAGQRPVKPPEAKKPKDDYGVMPKVETKRPNDIYERGDLLGKSNSPEKDYVQLPSTPDNKAIYTDAPAYPKLPKSDNYGELEMRPVEPAPQSSATSSTATSSTAVIMSSKLYAQIQLKNPDENDNKIAGKGEYGELKLKKPEKYVGLTENEEIVPQTPLPRPRKP